MFEGHFENVQRLSLEKEDLIGGRSPLELDDDELHLFLELDLQILKNKSSMLSLMIGECDSRSVFIPDRLVGKMLESGKKDRILLTIGDFNIPRVVMLIESKLKDGSYKLDATGYVRSERFD